jgi:predicted permease
MWRDLAFSLRTLRRSPVFTAVAVISLALGIGANTAIFSLVDQVILRLLPVHDPQRLVVLHGDYDLNGSSTADNYESVYSFSMYRELRDHAQGFAGVIARSGGGVTLQYQGNAEAVDADVVSGNYFQTLGVGSAAGRVFTAEDDRTPDAHPVVVLSQPYWAKRFASNRNIVGQKIAINGFPMTAIGVAAAGFHGVFSGHEPDIYLPLMEQHVFKPSWKALNDPQFRWLNLMARLAPGMTIERAKAASAPAHRAGIEIELRAQHDKTDEKTLAKYQLQLIPAAQGINELRRSQQTPLLALMAMAGLVLLIACANVASLTIARATARHREMGIRLAIGATRWNLIRQLLMEGAILAAAGGALGLVVANWSTRALLSALPADFAGQWLEAGLNLRLLGFAFSASAVSGLLFALIPAMQASRHEIASGLRTSSAMSTGGAVWFRKCVVAAQVALSLMLVVAAGLFSGTLYNLANVNMGFHTERLLVFKIDAARTRPQAPDAAAFYRDLERRFRAIPGVAAVGASETGPFSNSGGGGNLTIEGYKPKTGEYVGGSRNAIGPGYFAALGIPLDAGREFDDRDAGAGKPVVVNEAFVRKYFAGRTALGAHLMFGGSSHPVLDREIIGVAADNQVGVRDEVKPTVYYPYMLWTNPARLAFYVRAARGDETRLAGTIRSAVRDADANVPVIDLEPISIRIADSLYADRLLAMLSTAFGALAALLAAIGLYGVVAFAVARRTAEIGLRMALGALPGDVLRMVLIEAGKLTAAGVLAGTAAALVLGRFVQSQLFGMKATDPLILAAAIAFLGLIALAAAIVPGWRASRISPVVALKYE